MPQLLCQLVAASIGTCCRSRFGTGGKNQAVGKEAPLRGGDFEPFISCFPVPDRINPALRYRTDPAVVKLRSQHIENRRSLPGVGVQIPVPVFYDDSQIFKKGKCFLHGKTADYLHGKISHSASVTGFPHKTIGKVAFTVPGRQNFLSNPIHMLQQGYLGALSCGEDSCCHAGGSGANDCYLFFHT